MCWAVPNMQEALLAAAHVHVTVQTHPHSHISFASSFSILISPPPSSTLISPFKCSILIPQPFRSHTLTICLPQIWPHLPAPALWPSSMPPLLSPKIRRMAQLLAERQQATDARFEQAGVEDRWAAIVFVETKASSQPGTSVAMACKPVAISRVQLPNSWPRQSLSRACLQAEPHLVM